MIKKVIHKTKQTHPGRQDENPFPFRTNTFQRSFDLNLLCIHYSDLEKYVSFNHYGIPTIDYKNPDAITQLNKAIM